jgi:hypothetical protein
MLIINKDKYKISPKHLSVFILVFMILTPIGTLTHELGHLIVAKHLSYDTKLHYSSISWESDLKKSVLDRYFKNQIEIENNLPFTEKEIYDRDVEIINRDDLSILLGGVLQTIIIGSIFFIFFFHSNKKSKDLSLLQWTYIFLSLFWLREIFNLFYGFCIGLYKGNNQFFYGDEARIADILDVSKGSILIPLAILSFGIVFYLIKKIPLKYKFTFIISALIGCPLGYSFWMFIFGPLIFPR